MSSDRIRAVIFDLDGTLINSTIDFRLMRERVVSYLLANGIPSEIVNSNDTVTSNLTRFRSFMREKGSEITLEKMELELNSLLIEVELKGVEKTTQIGGAREILRTLRGSNYRTGLLTRGSRTYAMIALAAAGLQNRCFDIVICRDDFPASEAKPDGRAMKRVAESLGLSTGECLMVGDHPIDMHCAVAAGSTFIGVLSGWSDAEKWKASDCRNIVQSIANLPDWLRNNS
ncbi:MAG: HAD family hydrolase [Methanomassiliicoccales archaeon]|nr:HAD family hydrolase [Methanomassiliicoccales archaeon]